MGFDDPTARLESLLEHVGGCGLFQIIIVTLSHIPKMAQASTSLFMSFGSYNPGWRCLDDLGPYANTSTTALGGHNSSTQHHDYNNSNNTAGTVFFSDEKSCAIYDKCQTVQFEPHTSTLVSEWGLVCGRSWIPSIIISIQMAGILVGSYLVSFIGDTLGRKWALCFASAVNAVFSIICCFSTSWVMFAVLEFFLGTTSAFFRFLSFVYSCEFLLPKWRAPVSCVPTFDIGAIIFAVSAMVTKDWRSVMWVNTAMAIVGLLSVVGLPRSLRWLIVQKKSDEALAVANKIARINRKKSIESGVITNFLSITDDSKQGNSAFAFGQLFRKGSRINSFVVGVIFLTLSASYFFIGFGLVAMPGNIYTNIIIFTCAGFFGNVVAAIVPNVAGRKRSLHIFLAFSAVCLFIAVGLTFSGSDEVKDRGVVVFSSLSSIAVSACWYVMTAYLAELYPTVIRSTAAGYANLAAQVGAIVAPYGVPPTPDTIYIPLIAVAVLNLLCCSLTFLFPETKGNPLQDIWEAKRDAASNSNKHVST